jgi:hypothetical protein
MSNIRYIRAPQDLSPQLRDFYGRVARQLGVDPSYVSQVARGERQSVLVEDALRCELTAIMKQGSRPGSRHEALFYSDHSMLLNRAVPFVAAALKSGDAAIVIATKSRRNSLVEQLNSDGFDVDVATKAGLYVAVDAATVLTKIMVNEMPKTTRFFKLMGGLIEKAMKAARKAHPRVAVFGEGVSLLWEEGKADATIRLEQLWNQIALVYEIDMLCGYRISSACSEDNNDNVRRICAEHSAVFSQEVS